MWPLLSRGVEAVRVRYWVALSLAGLALRAALIPVSPAWGYHRDHDLFVRWAILATDYGLLTVYDGPPPKHDIQVWDAQTRSFVRTEEQQRDWCNYPPLSVYLLYVSGLVFKVLSPERLINTWLSHAIFSSWTILADFLLAWGCAATVAHFRPGRAAFWTYAAVLLAPPLWYDSLVWGQVDSWVLAPAVWMLWAILRQRWILAGVLYGIAAGLKPQAVLFLPLWGLVLLTSRQPIKVLLSGLIAGAVLGLCALPFMLHSGWAWLKLSYIGNFFHAAPYTTLSAFNIWYVDALLGTTKSATLTWLGLTKDVWGRTFLLIALAVGFVGVLIRWRREPRGLLIWTVLSLLAFMMLPTRVHERYLVLVLPFLIMLAVLYARFVPTVVILALVMMAQITWPHWIKLRPGAWVDFFEPAARIDYEAYLTELPPQERARAQTYDEFTRDARQEFAATRARSAPFEWMGTILALLASAGVATTAATLKPPPAALQQTTRAERKTTGTEKQKGRIRGARSR
jgi:Gpi18-like mannosyltransferase